MTENLIHELFELLIKDVKKKKILSTIMEGKESGKTLDKILEDKMT